MRGGLALTESQRMEMLISCINPPVLIRNIIAATIVGLAARDPVLRRHTEIVHINPLDILAKTNHSSSPSEALRPSTVIVPMGSDIAARAFQIPLVTFRQDPIFESHLEEPLFKGVGPLDEINNVSAGTVFPLSNSTPPYRDADEVIHSELANQLRRCLHLYLTSKMARGSRLRSVVSPLLTCHFLPNRGMGCLPVTLSAELLVFTLGSTRVLAPFPQSRMRAAMVASQLPERIG
jgi:hypothetical protein